MPTHDWQVVCDQEAFEKCRKDERFPYIVALGRAINALTFVRSVMSHHKDVNTPAAKRDRLNSYLFGSAIIYEALRLIRAMGKTFREDDTYQRGLRLLLADPIARQIEQDHLKAARHRAIFHFNAETFRETIKQGSPDECPFISGQDKKRVAIFYAYSDIVAAEILVGCPIGNEDFTTVLADAVVKTDNLVEDFIKYTEALMSYHLPRWGFVSRDAPTAAPASPED